MKWIRLKKSAKPAPGGALGLLDRSRDIGLMLARRPTHFPPALRG